MRFAWAAAVALLAAAAGCLEGPLGGTGTPGDSAAPTPGPDGTPTPGPLPTARPAPTPGGTPPGGMGNATPQPPVNRTWPEPGAATIRPGVQVTVAGQQCTSNFVFTSPDNATVYLGIAAHCASESADPTQRAWPGCDRGMNRPFPLGTAAEVEGARQPARLAYSSWLTMQSGNETDEDACRHNDFALVALTAADANATNPAMLFFGGPTALADPAGVRSLDKVLTYGNSGLRLGLSALSPHEGYVTSAPYAGGWATDIHTAPPGVPGDSGSGVLMGDGRALGVLVTVSYAGGANGVTSLAPALAYAAQEGGVEARLATWAVMDAGILPPLP